MTSYELISILQPVLKEAGGVREFAANLSLARGDMARTLESLATANKGDAQSLVSLAGNYQTELRNYFREFRKYPSRTIWNSFEKTRANIEEAVRKGFTFSTDSSSVLDEFAESYEAYIQEASLAATARLILAGSNLTHSFEEIEHFIAMVSKLLGGEQARGSEGVLEVQLSSRQTAHEFARKLRAIVELYEELCSLLAISSASHPMRIGKVESGSLLAKLFGESKVIALAVNLIEGGTRYLHRAYTKEGKISAIPRKAESLEAVLHLRASLKAAGINTEAMEPHIEKSAVLIASQLEELLSGEARVIVNEAVISIPFVKTELELLEDNDIKLLGNDSDDNDSVPPLVN